MQKKTQISIAAIIAIIGLGSGVFAISNVSDAYLQEVETVYVKGSLPGFTLEELAKGTNHAIIGEVKEITPVKVERENREFVFSDVVIAVQQDLFGEYTEKEITVRIQGGQIDDLRTISEDDASFSLNEHVLVFVAGPEPDSIWGNNYYVAGLVEGKYTLVADKASQENSNRSLDKNELISQIQSYRGIK